MHCLKCGQEAKHRARFCKRCGARLIGPYDTLPLAELINERYSIVWVLSKKEFSNIYLAWDLVLHQSCLLSETVASKWPWEISQSDFEYQAKRLTSLSHPNLVKVTDFFSRPERGFYLVMDVVDGEDLIEWWKREPKALSAFMILKCIQKVGDALTYLHKQNPPIIHRDVKPDSIRITPNGMAILVNLTIYPGLASPGEDVVITLSNSTVVL